MLTRTTLAKFLMEGEHDASLNVLLLEIALAAKAISSQVARGGSATELDAAANELVKRATGWGGLLAGMVSENEPEPIMIEGEGGYVLYFDPLDGAANVDVNSSVGSIFSVARAPDLLQPGTGQVAAGYALYGPSTMLVLTLGNGVNGFTLDPVIGEFFLTHPNMRLPEQSSEFAVNHSNRRFWDPAIRRYVDECLAGLSGPRSEDFSVRWVASLVAEAHRVLIRGGVCLYPSDSRDVRRPNRLRLLCEVNPIAFVVEQAGGWASNGAGRSLEMIPGEIHQRVPLFFGAAHEVEVIERYYREAAAAPGSTADDDELELPFYAVRGLFRTTQTSDWRK